MCKPHTYPLRRHQRVKGDSGNYHEIDFVVEGAVAPPENLTELMKAAEDAFKRLENERLYEEEKSLARWVAYSKSFAEFNAAVDRLINSFRYDVKMLIEVKGVGWGGEEPTEQTYRELKQKYVIVSFMLWAIVFYGVELGFFGIPYSLLHPFVE